MKVFLTIVVSIVFVAFVALGFGLWARGALQFGGTGQPLTVRIEPAKRGVLTEIVSAPGRVMPRTKVSISARVVARVLDLPFKEGETVSKGGPTTKPSLLVSLDAKDLQAKLRAVEARYEGSKSEISMAKARMASQSSQIAASKASLAEAERDLKRQKQLYESKDVSAAVVEGAQSKYDGLAAQLEAALHTVESEQANVLSMESALKAAEAEVAQAREDVGYAVIESPIDGVITKINTEIGELVVTGTMNNPGTVLLEVADLNHMFLVARVDETAVAAVKVGQKARVRVQAYSEEVFDGTVETVGLKETEDKDGSRYYETKILLKTDGRRILSGLNGDAEIETRRHDDVLKIPSQAVLGRPVDGLPPGVRDSKEVDHNKTFATVVYRYVDGKAVVTPVTVGPSDITHTIILSGVNEGDPIVVGPYKVLESLAHDQKLKDEREAGAATKPSAVASAK